MTRLSLIVSPSKKKKRELGAWDAGEKGNTNGCRGRLIETANNKKKKTVANSHSEKDGYQHRAL